MLSKALFSVVLLPMVFCFKQQQVNVDSSYIKHSYVKTGKQLYEIHCMRCHGPDGKQKLNGAADLSKTILSQAAIVRILNGGPKKDMPSFKTTLTDEEKSLVAAYVKQFKKK